MACQAYHIASREILIFIGTLIGIYYFYFIDEEIESQSD